MFPTSILFTLLGAKLIPSSVVLEDPVCSVAPLYGGVGGKIWGAHAGSPGLVHNLGAPFAMDFGDRDEMEGVGG